MGKKKNKLKKKRSNAKQMQIPQVGRSALRQARRGYEKCKREKNHKNKGGGKRDSKSETYGKS